MSTAPHTDHGRLERSVDTFLTAAGQADLSEIRVRLTASCRPDIRYADPIAATVGVEELARHLRSLYPTLAGRIVRRVSQLDAHHGWVRVGWVMTDPAGRPAMEGMHVFEHDLSGVLIRGLGFFGELPARWFVLSRR